MKIRNIATDGGFNSGSEYLHGKNLLFFLIFTVFCLPVSVSAQGLLEEIIVTAQKREQNMQDVPIAITVMDENAIERSGLAGISDLAFQVPTLQFSSFGSIAAVSLRGISYENTTPGGDPGVAMHIDGVYLGRPVATVFDVWDMERMEVLRGPQGTLYGRNATGGSVNFISKRPTDELEGKVDFTAGNFDRLRARGIINVPVNDRVKARFSGMWEDRDGFQENRVAGGTEGNDKDAYSLRGSFLVDINEDAELLVIANYADTGGVGRSFERRDPFERCAPPAPCAVLPGGIEYGGVSSTPVQLVNDQIPHVVSKDTPEFSDQEFRSVAGTLTWDLGNMTFKSITAYAETAYHTLTDLDGSERPIFAIELTENQDQFTQEVQLSSNSDGPLQWIVGGFFFTEEADRRSTICNDDFQSFTRAPGAAGFNGSCQGFGVISPTGQEGFSSGGDIESTSYAVFTQLDYSLTESITLTAGARFSWDEKTASLNQFLPFAPVGNFIPPSPGNPCPCVLVPGAGPVPFGGLNGPPVAPIITRNFRATSEQSWSEPTWKFNANWAVTDDVNLYALYSRGYKSGGANLNGATIEEAFYDPEFIDSYEIGAKMRLMDKIQLNISAYHNEVDDLQLQVFGNGGAILANAASATVQGVEIESTFVVTEAFEINGSVGLMDAEYDEFLQRLNAVTIADRSGNDLNRAPNVTFNLGSTYSWQMGDIGSFAIRADFHWQDKQFFQPDNIDQIRVDSYHNLDVRGFWYSTDEKWTIEAYATNLTDQAQIGDILRSVPFQYGAVDLTTYKAPQMYGVRLGYSFF